MKKIIWFILTFLLIACNSVEINRDTSPPIRKINVALIKNEIEQDKNFFYYQGYKCIEKNKQSYCYDKENGFLIFEQIKNFNKKSHLLKEYYYSKNGYLMKYGKSSYYPVGIWFFYDDNENIISIDVDKEFMFTEKMLKEWLRYIGAQRYVIKRDILNNYWIIDFGGILIYLNGRDGKIMNIQIEKIQSMYPLNVIAKDEECIKDNISQKNGYQKMLKKCGYPPSIIF